MCYINALAYCSIIHSGNCIKCRKNLKQDVINVRQ